MIVHLNDVVCHVGADFVKHGQHRDVGFTGAGGSAHQHVFVAAKGRRKDLALDAVQRSAQQPALKHVSNRPCNMHNLSQQKVFGPAACLFEVTLLEIRKARCMFLKCVIKQAQKDEDMDWFGKRAKSLVAIKSKLSPVRHLVDADQLLPGWQAAGLHSRHKKPPRIFCALCTRSKKCSSTLF